MQSREFAAQISVRAISIVKNDIDNILFQLEMGSFAISEEETSDPRLSLYQLTNDFRSYRYHPIMYYPLQASPTPSSTFTTMSSPYTSPLSTKS